MGLRRRFAMWLRWQREQRELREELATHRALKRDELARGGLSGARLETATERAMGNELAAREQAREVWLWSWLATLGRGLRLGARGLRRSPGFAAVGVITLALGIGATTAIFSVVEAVLLRPLPYPGSSRIAALTLRNRADVGPALTLPEILYVRGHARSFAALAGYRGRGTVELDHGGAIDWARGADATDGFFEVLGETPVLGRGFVRSDTAADAPSVVVLTDALWRSAFQASPGVLGRQIEINRQPATVIGVLPADFQFLEQPVDFFSNLHAGNGMGNSGTNTAAIARLRARVSLAQAQAEVRVLSSEMGAKNLLPSRGDAVGLETYHSVIASPERASLWLLFAAVAMLLLIACANVAGLVLVRALARGRETALRRALGAGPAHLAVQFTAEGLVLAACGGAAGGLLALGLLRLLARQIPWAIPPGTPIRLDSGVLAFTAAVVCAAAVFFGLASLVRTRRASLLPSAYAGRTRGREWLVAGEVALALLLLAGAGLLLRSLAWLEGRPLGFQPAGVTVFSTEFAANEARNESAAWQLDRQILTRLQAIPGVSSAALTTLAPLRGQNNLPVQPLGAGMEAKRGDSVEYRAVSGGFFATLEIPLRAGRGFEARDTAAAPRVAVINESLARRWFGGPERALGGQIRIGVWGNHVYVPEAMAAPRAVVGVVGDIRAVRLEEAPRLAVYVPAAQAPETSDDWVVRGGGQAMDREIRVAVASVNPATRISGLQPYTAVLGAAVAEPAFLARVLALFALLALALTAVGIYGLLAYSVARRTREIGIRLALGARPETVRWSVMGRGLAIAAAGMAAGLLAAWPLGRLLAGMLYGVQPGDGANLGAAAGLLALVALGACWAPARRATRVDPVEALRQE